MDAPCASSFMAGFWRVSRYGQAMEDLVLKAEAAAADLGRIPVADIGVRTVTLLTADGVFETLSLEDARPYLLEHPHLLVNRVMAAKRLGVPVLAAFDLLELFAFIRPARFCLPTIAGLLSALTIQGEAATAEDRCLLMQEAARHLLADPEAETYRFLEGLPSVARMMAAAGWPWGVFVLKALEARNPVSARRERDGLAVWSLLEEWQEGPPPARPGDAPVKTEESKNRLGHILGKDAESREAQRRYAETATHAFSPREFAEGPNLQILEAGTGTGKTLGYIAPASLWAEKNDAPVWLATYTKNLQRQLDQELSKLYPDPKKKYQKAVIRKGRENYACLLNIEETLRALMLRSAATPDGEGSVHIDYNRVLLGLVVRWARFSRDGDMIGGDFPSWLGGHFGARRLAGLTDRRGECLYSACAHYRKCFIEKAVRRSRQADLVVANHALVMVQAAMRGDDPDRPTRFVFDEGHHLFDAADSAFSVHLSGQEGAELRRWLRGKESGGSTRARGLKNRLEELITDDEEARLLLNRVLGAAQSLPGDNWLGRVAGAAANSKFEQFLMLVRTQILARCDARGPYGLETEVSTPVEGLVEAGQALAVALHDLATPMRALAGRLLTQLDDEAETLDSGDRGRLEAGAQSLRLRVEMVAVWAAMAEGLQKETPDDFCDWLALERIGSRELDVGMYRHFIDPSKPFAATVLDPAHGVLITSATLRDRLNNKEQNVPEVDGEAKGEAWQQADARVGAHHLMVAPRRLKLPSPFDYGAQTRCLIVTDVNKNDPDQLAAAYRALFLASNGGALGLFTAISRLRATYDRLAAPLDDMDIRLYAQHIDPINTATLVDIFREDKDSCLLGTDAVRDGVDVPGDSLRLIVFERVPWPRRTLLHRARQKAFGGRTYDEMLVRLRVAQAFGRLVRQATDRGVFVMLDGQTPSRLLEGLPPGVEPERVGLKEAIVITRDFTADTAT